MKRDDNALPDRKKIRLKQFDYSRAGWYFVTICAHDRQCLFGEIVDDQIVTSQIGKVVESCWNEIPDHSEHAKTDAFVVMPNHVHGIVMIERAEKVIGLQVGAQHAVPAQGFQALKARSLSAIVRSFKSAVSKEVRAQGATSARTWQRGFYEHIIRDEDSLFRIRQYIAANPKNWATDEDNLNGQI